MKNINRSFFALVIAIAVSASSCVKNEVSPEVQKLREAQVAAVEAATAYKNAETAYKQAQTAYQEAETAYQAAQTKSLEISNAYNEANNALELQKRQAELTTALKQQEASLKNAEANLKQAEIYYEQQVAALAEVVKTAKNTQAANYLNNYTSYMNQAYNYYWQRLNAEDQLATQKLLLNGNLSWDFLKSELEADKAKTESELAAAQAALAALEAMDMTTLEADIAAKREEVAGYKKDSLGLAVTLEEASNAAVNAGVLLQYNADVRVAYQDLMDEMEQLDMDIDDKANVIAAKTEGITAQETAISEKEATISSLTTVYTTRKASYDPLQTIVIAKKEAMDVKLQAANDAEFNFQVVDVTYDSGDAQFTSADNARNAAWTAYWDATNEYNQAVADRDQVYNAGYSDVIEDWLVASAELSGYENLTYTTDGSKRYDIGVMYYLWALTDEANSLEGQLADMQADLTVLNAEKAELDTDKTQLQARIDAKQADYDEAVAEKDALEDLKDQADEAENQAQVAYDMNNDMMDQMEAVLALMEKQLEVYYEDADGAEMLKEITDAIAAYQAEVETLQRNIADLDGQIARNGVDKAEAEGRVAQYTAELANLNARLAETEQMAAYWKGLLDALIAG